MNKKRIIETVANETGLHVKDVRCCIDAIISSIRESVRKGENVKIRNFGTFKMVEYKQKKVLGIHCGQMIELPGHKGVRFVASDEFLK